MRCTGVAPPPLVVESGEAAPPPRSGWVGAEEAWERGEVRGGAVRELERLEPASCLPWVRSLRAPHGRRPVVQAPLHDVQHAGKGKEMRLQRLRPCKGRARTMEQASNQSSARVYELWPHGASKHVQTCRSTSSLVRGPTTSDMCRSWRRWASSIYHSSPSFALADPMSALNDYENREENNEW